MLNVEINRLLTEVGPGTPAGAMLRAYWQPIALVAELGAKPVAVRVLGEELVLYRTPAGVATLVGGRCPHRGTSLAGGRIETRGLRCCYHGWLFDAAGQCIEQPGERGSGFAAKVRIASYPVQEAYGLVWAYLSAGAPPVLPPYDILARGDGHRAVAKAAIGCNYLQVLENSVDPVHTAILHVDTDLEQAYQEVPDFEVETTDIGIRTTAWRPGSGYRRKVEFAFPSLTRVTLPFMKPVVQMGFWVTPNDDVSATLYMSWFVPIPPGTDAAAARALGERMEHHMWELTPEDRINLSSRVIRQDIFACETQGTIVDRSAEHLGSSDRGVILLRQRFQDAIEAVRRGEDPPGVVRAAPPMIAFDQVA